MLILIRFSLGHRIKTSWWSPKMASLPFVPYFFVDLRVKYDLAMFLSDFGEIHPVVVCVQRACRVSVLVYFIVRVQPTRLMPQKSSAYFQQMRSAHTASIHNSFSACSLVGKHAIRLFMACFRVIECLLVTWRNHTLYGSPRVMCNMFQD